MAAPAPPPPAVLGCAAAGPARARGSRSCLRWAGPDSPRFPASPIDGAGLWAGGGCPAPRAEGSRPVPSPRGGREGRCWRKRLLGRFLPQEGPCPAAQPGSRRRRWIRHGLTGQGDGTHVMGVLGELPWSGLCPQLPGSRSEVPVPVVAERRTGDAKNGGEKMGKCGREMGQGKQGREMGRGNEERERGKGKQGREKGEEEKGKRNRAGEMEKGSGERAPQPPCKSPDARPGGRRTCSGCIPIP